METGFAQGRSIAAKSPRATVPFVGCPSDGQIGPQEAPKGDPKTVQFSAAIARQLAYYKSAVGDGVLAPRGWYCFGLLGSSGSSFYVSPSPIDVSGFSGIAIERSFRYGDGSGRFEVARVMARVFPDYRTYVTNLVKEWEFDLRDYPFGPYPTDRVIYRNKNVVEYQTPAEAEGLGTESLVRKSSSPMDGVAILLENGEDAPNLLLLSLRLPASFATLAPVIIGQVERDAAQLPK